MADADRLAGKRSRFDQTEPEPKRASRFDRRSRSPPARRFDARERSPLSRDPPSESTKSPIDAAAAAAAAAARINAQLQARKGIQHVDVPPINKPEQSPTPPASVKATTSSAGSATARTVDGAMYVADGDYIKDIEVNDLRNRYLLTKSSTQKMIKDETGADVTTRGSYYPNKNMATAASPPLYLHITSTTKDGLEAAVAKVQELIQQELPQLVDERRFRRRDQEQQPQVERDEYGRRKWPEEKIPVGLEPVPGFNLRAQIIKGLGSGYLENATNRESEEEMFLHVTGPDPAMVAKGKELCEDLVANVKEQYEEFKSRPPRGDRGGYGDHHRGGRSHEQPSYGRSGSDQATNSVTTGGVAANGSGNAQDWSQYAAQYYSNGQDPYAAYGGYQNYVAWYQYYYQQQAQGQGAPTAPGQAAPGQAAAPPPGDAAPPPPPADAAPPPPMGASPAPGSGYNAVPPPPGL
ncbi:putative kh domain-containing protein [Hirsutella rhossiliensis]|uniref:Kh domain-containing protein n=1 Tax=Hirsutella rhossiliensis TaxID=111463 RepID=A0A9P8SLJ3_9HYPO|nr:putative kh domain-containing protein [Hirsutella rhossiliensis]KAH0967021.1 putative kh domain-containing protein [Hirsutella rhossiliensis]